MTDYNSFIENYSYNGINILSLAKDLVLYGEAHIKTTLESYGLSKDDLMAIKQMPAFKKEVRELRTIIDSSPNALIQMKARDILENGLKRLSDMILDPATSNTDVLKAVKEVSRIAIEYSSQSNGVEEVGTQQAVNGLVLNLSLNGNKGISSLLPPIDVTEGKVLREVE